MYGLRPIKDSFFLHIFMDIFLHKYRSNRVILNRFYNYISFQVVGGWVALKFGGILVICLSMLFASIFTMLIVPIANLNSVAAVFFFRFLIGFSHVKIKV